MAGVGVIDKEIVILSTEPLEIAKSSSKVMLPDCYLLINWYVPTIKLWNNCCRNGHTGRRFKVLKNGILGTNMEYKMEKLIEEQKANRVIWYKHLRSGKYNQCQRKLNNKGEMTDGSVSYCCLGVADELFNCEYTYSNIMKKLGIKCTITCSYIYMLNDDIGMTFPQIADELENNEGKYFNLEGVNK